MAREYARYLTRTHRDDDWRQLSSLHHDAYMALASSADISWCGVVPYVPARYAGFSTDLSTSKRVEKVWQELADRDYLILDQTEGELLVRTFIRHDNLLAKPNLTKAMLTAYRKVRSCRIIAAINGELAKLQHDLPKLSGWAVIAEQFPELFTELFPEQFPKPFKG